ncbi:HAD family hydrolase [Humitalea sp. 24SJ18S-53]|uniref:HAD family hydrolase n=1 Tax=Humitalea sp. 24SJ18S-53 TaxID=3422307 RepID=UPI003D66E8BD
MMVLFDMDDVLCDYRRDVRCAHLAAVSGRRPQDVEAAIWGGGIEAAADAGTLDAAAYLAACGDALGHPLTEEEWLTARGAAMTARPGVLAMVAALRTPIAVLTNNTSLVGTHIDRLFPELRPLFGEAIFTSGGLGLAKPDPACFLACLHRLGAAPAETLFIDDLAENVRGAQAAGLSAWQYTSEAGLADVLRGRGLL